MPVYTVIINGVPIQCETAADAIELTRQAAADGVDSAKPAPGFNSANVVGPSRWTEQRVGRFFALIQEKQRKLVDALLEAPDPMTDDQLCRLLGITDGRALGGVITGLYKNAKKAGADPNELYERESVMIGDTRHFEYKLTDAFRGAAAKWKS